MSERKMVSLESLLKIGVSYGIVQPGSAEVAGVPIVRVKDVRNGRIDTSDPLRVSPGVEEKYSRTRLQGGEVLLTLVGSTGQVAIAPDGLAGWNVARAIGVLRPDSDISPRWLQYFIESESAQQYIRDHLNTTVQATLNLKDLRVLPVPLPSRQERDAIVSVIGALDDKIAVNENIVATTDELMRVLYQEACGNAVESIVIGELGRLIRDGVSVSSLNGGEHYIGLEHMPRRNVWLSEWEENAELASGKSTFRSNDVLFGKLRPYFHKVGLALTSGVCSTDILVVRPSESDRLGWLLLALSSDEVVAHASAVGDGTRMPRAKWKDLESFAVPWPGKAEAARLDRVVRSMAARVQASVQESRTLVGLRHALLPQLMSGRLRVKDAEKIVEDHA
ncbi:restriction endonuclease subunit S [Streptomyces sp. SID4946]|uniref:restriction endonuclease subunit S n=1 Tax=Streptomyces sp. LamerLS-31b TaxID=1839765 RepID=UPI00081EA5D8|nr:MULTISPECIES: restriction endonuclease subunit S [unclassified Streptomyces]MYQ95779.1 restriction endonuclease subunit S [Streptomyces sp. SID4946]SCF97499.1 type I restriction enzyme, S subunit [Streptomyces sp. DconLS]SCG02307.1 type I restriction enzyme, S subunit [Streptomyces sp. LamerLS-31b]